MTLAFRMYGGRLATSWHLLIDFLHNGILGAIISGPERLFILKIDSTGSRGLSSYIVVLNLSLNI